MKKILLTFLLTFLIMPIAYAEKEIYFTNYSGVEMTKEEYDYLLQHFDKGIVYSITQGLFESALESVDNIQISDADTIYIETTTYKSPTGTITNTEKIITKEEYDNYNPIMPLTSCEIGISCWETNAKRLALIMVSDNDGNRGVCVNNSWKSLPQIRSYDVIALRWSMNNSNATYLNAVGLQDGGSAGDTIYSPSSSNMKIASNGVGISMNLYNNADDLNNYLYVYFKINGNVTLSYYGTYQHATSDLTLSQSMGYTFGSGGLGNTINFSSATISNKYDGMQGVSSMVAYVPQ